MQNRNCKPIYNNIPNVIVGVVLYCCALLSFTDIKQIHPYTNNTTQQNN